MSSTVNDPLFIPGVELVATLHPELAGVPAVNLTRAAIAELRGSPLKLLAKATFQDFQFFLAGFVLGKLNETLAVLPSLPLTKAAQELAELEKPVPVEKGIVDEATAAVSDTSIEPA